MIEIRNLFKSYSLADGHRLEVLHGINLTVKDGEIVSIIGASGSGKSTLLRCLNGLEKADSGEVIFNGKTLNGEPCKSMGMVFQNFNIFEHLNVLQNVTLAPRKLLKLSSEEAEQEAMKFLRQVGMAEKADAMPSELSGGQKQRVAIARCLAMHPDCILFDEPTSALDPTMVNEVLSVIRQLAAQGEQSNSEDSGLPHNKPITILIVTHEMNFAHNISTRVIFFSNGNITEDGTPQQIFENPQNEDTRNFIQRFHKLH